MTSLPRSCAACEGLVPPLDQAAIRQQLDTIAGDWRLVDGPRLERAFQLASFREALSFVNAVGAIAEAAGHHPEIAISWNVVHLRLWTHAVDALTEADFSLAAQIDASFVSQFAGNDGHA
jgi:4a-hydroxytetrahydrobiopterin dehydratase